MDSKKPFYRTKSICIYDLDIENTSIHIENQNFYEPINHQQFSILKIPEKEILKYNKN